jgi:hypothetical protein
MADIIVAGNTSGAITISAPLVAGSGVLTLPTGTDTLVGKATTDTLTNKSIAATQLTGTIAAAALPAGCVLQVVSASTSTQVSSSSSTYADTGLTATITPRNTSSKILVLVSQHCRKTNGNGNNGTDIKLFRDATDLGKRIYAQGYTNSLTENYTQAAFQYLDSPSTTSATVYKTQFANNAGNVAMVSVQTDNIGVSIITLMEIQG